MARKKTVIHQHELIIEHDRKKYRASYFIESGTVTVETISKNGVIIKSTTQIGGSPSEVIARILLREMIKSGKVAESQK